MSAGLILLAVVVGAYLAAHVLFDWIGRRFFVVSGAEYLLLGILLGPEVSGILNTSVLDPFAPLMTLALGWIGALIGAQFFVPGLLRIEGAHFRVAFFEALTSLAVISGLCTFVLYRVVGANIQAATVAGIALGAIGVASAPAGIALVARELSRRDSLVHQLEVTTAIDALVGIVAFGVLVGIMHTPPVGPVRAPTATEWVAISLGIGFVGGALFHLFLGNERNPDRLFIALAGAIILTSGAAAYLRLSPLLVNLIVGAVLVNTSHSAFAIRDVLARIERPLYYVLLLFVGAAWTSDTGALWLAAVVLYPLIRIFAKLGSARLAARVEGTLDVVGLHWGRALLGHGGVAVAIAFNYQLLDTLPYRTIVFTAAIVSVILTDLLSARLVRDVLNTYRRRAIAAMQAALRLEHTRAADAQPDNGEAIDLGTAPLTPPSGEQP